MRSRRARLRTASSRATAGLGALDAPAPARGCGPEPPPVDERAAPPARSMSSSVRDHLVAGDGLAHLHPALRVGAGGAPGRLRDAEALDGHRHPRLVHEGQDLGEAGPARAEQLRAAPLEAELAGGGAADDHLLLGLGHAEVVAPVLEARDDEQGEALEALGPRPRAARGRRRSPPHPFVMNCLRPVTRQWSPSGTASGGDVADIRSRVGLGSWPRSRRSCPRPAAAPSARLLPRVPKRAIGTAGPWWKTCSRNVFVQARRGPGQEGARGHREVGAAEVAREVHPHDAQLLQPWMLREEGGRLDDLAVHEARRPARVDLARVGAISRAAYCRHHAQRLVVQSSRARPARGPSRSGSPLPRAGRSGPSHPSRKWNCRSSLSAKRLVRPVNACRTALRRRAADAQRPSRAKAGLARWRGIQSERRDRQGTDSPLPTRRSPGSMNLSAGGPSLGDPVDLARLQRCAIAAVPHADDVPPCRPRHRYSNNRLIFISTRPIP